MSSIYLNSSLNSKSIFRAQYIATHDSKNEISEWQEQKTRAAINHCSEAYDSEILDPAGAMAAAESSVHSVAVYYSVQMVVNKGDSAANKQATLLISQLQLYMKGQHRK